MTAANQSFDNNSGWAQKKLSSYLFGFTACLIITLLAFGLVHYSLINKTATYISLTVLAFVQMFIQTVCFLGLKADPAGRWNVLPFLFIILIIFFIAGGTLWIMYNLNVLMMDI